jgi:hypothetical protein
VTAREIGRETSHSLVEIRTVLSRAETALAALHEFRSDAHYWHGYNAGRGECFDGCPGINSDGGGSGRVETRRWSDPDYAEAKEALQATIDALGKFRRTGRPRRATT